MRKRGTFLGIFVLLMILFIENELYATTPPPEVLPPEPATETIEDASSSAVQASAIVTEVGEIKELHTDYTISKVQEVEIEILEGKFEAKEFIIDYVFSYDDLGEKNSGYPLKVGDKVTVEIIEDEAGVATAHIQDVIRNTHVMVIVGIFFATLILILRKHAVKPLVSLLMIGIAIAIAIKGMDLGYSAIWITILIAGILLLVNSILLVGFNKKALTVALGTWGSVLISGVLALVFSHVAKTSGTYEDTISLKLNMTTIHFYFKDLIFAGVVISSLGIQIHSAITIVTKLDDIKKKTEDMSRKKLFKTGMQVGAEVAGSTANALILMYIGSSLTIILMFLACNIGIQQLLNKETIAQNVISATAGSMGIIMLIPIIAGMYSFFHYRKTNYKTTSDNKLDGNRSLKL